MEEKTKINNNTHSSECIPTTGTNFRSTNNRSTRMIENKENQDVNEKSATDNSCSIALNIEEAPDKKKGEENMDASSSGTSGTLSRLRRRNPVSYCDSRPPSPESGPSTSGKKMRTKKASTSSEKTTYNYTEEETRILCTTNGSLERNSDDAVNINVIPVGLEKMKYEVEINQNLEDRYTKHDFPGPEVVAESPETRRERIDIISRQCRLHPANKKYNQGPVENPPPITPGVLVGYTPGGQRHEVDLNFDRPTWFNSEYARMQFDTATQINTRRMMYDLESGIFLPDSLDPDVERRHFAEQELASQESTEHFNHILNGPVSDIDIIGEDKLRTLEIERQLLEIIHYAVVRHKDFAGEVIKKLRIALELNLTTVMMLKNPYIVAALEKLVSQRIHIEMSTTAQSLLDKIKALFQVPDSTNFNEFFASEVENFRKLTEDLTGTDIMVMPAESVSVTDDAEVLADPVAIDETSTDSFENEVIDEWFAVDNGDTWQDIRTHFDDNNGAEFVSNMSLETVHIGSSVLSPDSSGNEDDSDFDFSDESGHSISVIELATEELIRSIGGDCREE